MNDVWHSAVIDFGCVSSRILWIKFNFSSVKVCVVVGWGTTQMKKTVKKGIDSGCRILKKLGNGYRLCTEK